MGILLLHRRVTDGRDAEHAGDVAGVGGKVPDAKIRCLTDRMQRFGSFDDQRVFRADQPGFHLLGAVGDEASPGRFAHVTDAGGRFEISIAGGQLSQDRFNLGQGLGRGFFRQQSPV